MILLSSLSLSFSLSLSCNIELISIISPPTDDTPNVLKLMEMKGTDGLNVVQRIAASNNVIFGMHLLHDENGRKVDLIKNNNRQDGAEGITLAIIKEWLRDGPEHTRTYDHLMECLRESGLGALADDIAKRTTGGGKSVYIHTSTVLPQVSCT